MTKAIVAFIDILGFQNMVNDCFENSDFGIIEILENALEKATDSVNEDSEILKKTPIDINFKQFSDCVSLSYKFSDENDLTLTFITFIHSIAKYQKLLMENGVFLRGGVSFDHHFESTQMIFSKALINAYKIESGENNKIKAHYPRIVIDPNLIQTIISDCKSINLPQLNDHINNLLIRDSNDICFVNPFSKRWYLGVLPTTKGLNSKQLRTRNTYLIKENKSIDNSIQQTKIQLKKNAGHPSIIEKYLWLMDFLNWEKSQLPSNQRFRKIV